MPLLSKELKEAFTAKKVSSSAGNELYFNPASVDAKKKARFTILGDDSLGGYQLFVTKKEGGYTCIRWASEPTDQEVLARVDEEGCNVIPGRERPQQFFAIAVWNYDRDYGKDEDKPNPGVQVATFTQRSIIDPLINALSDEEIAAEVTIYDFVMSHNEMEQKDKRYSLLPLPGKRRNPKVEKQIDEIWQEVVQKGFDLKALLVGGDPFNPAF